MKTKDYIWRRDSGLCVYCGELGQQIDHVLPRKHRGPNIRQNFVLACLRCNLGKRDRLDLGMITTAFHHLLRVGESLDWVDRVVDPSVDLVSLKRVEPPLLEPVAEMVPIYLYTLPSLEEQLEARRLAKEKRRLDKYVRLMATPIEITRNRVRKLQIEVQKLIAICELEKSAGSAEK